jgi:hypothetical protein
MTEPVRDRQFVSPTVREIVEERHEPTPPPERQQEAVSQRALVAASLLAMPRD